MDTIMTKATFIYIVTKLILANSQGFINFGSIIITVLHLVSISQASKCNKQ